MSGIQTYDGVAGRFDAAAMAEFRAMQRAREELRAFGAAAIALACNGAIRMPARITRAQILGSACPQVYTIADVLEAPVQHDPATGEAYPSRWELEDE